MITTLTLALLTLGAAPAAPQAAEPLCAAALSCNVVDELGQVPTGLQFRLHAQVGEEVLGGFVIPDAEGMVRLDIPEAYRRDLCTRFTVIPVGAPGEAGDWSRALTIDVPADQAGKVIELGVHALSSAPILYGGTVVDEAGLPIPGATVTMEAAKDTASDSITVAIETLQMRSITDDQGRFMFRGRPGHSPNESGLRIRAEAPSCILGETQEFETGKEDGQLKLLRGGSATFDWSLPESMRGAALFVRLEPMGEDANPDHGFHFPAPRSPVTLPAIRVGLYRFALEDEAGNTVYQVDGVEVHPGEAVQDDRVVGVDLSDRLESLVLTVGTEQGKKLGIPYTVWTQPSVEVRARRIGHLRPDGNWQIVLGIGGTADVMVAANRYRPVEVNDLQGEAEIGLRPSLIAGLTLLDAEVLKTETRFLAVALLVQPPPEGEMIFRPGYTVWVEGGGPVAGRELKAILPGPGSYLVRWTVYERDETGRPRVVGTVDGDLLDIPDEGGLQFETPMPPEVWTIQAE